MYFAISIIIICIDFRLHTLHQSVSIHNQGNVPAWESVGASKKKTTKQKSWRSWQKKATQEFWRGHDSGKLKTLGNSTVKTRITEDGNKNGNGAEGNKTPAHKFFMFKIPNLATQNSDIKSSHLQLKFEHTTRNRKQLSGFL